MPRIQIGPKYPHIYQLKKPSLTHPGPLSAFHSHSAKKSLVVAHALTVRVAVSCSRHPCDMGRYHVRCFALGYRRPRIPRRYRELPLSLPDEIHISKSLIVHRSGVQKIDRTQEA
ncbi:hypothetical protein AX14_009181 [Amanita brunnescens Koide BX004]|nr:hypothetical protein AX14_009181 [Amanita brunnescens Koide BX004]